MHSLVSNNNNKCTTVYVLLMLHLLFKHSGFHETELKRTQYYTFRINVNMCIKTYNAQYSFICFSVFKIVLACIFSNSIYTTVKIVLISSCRNIYMNFVLCGTCYPFFIYMKIPRYIYFFIRYVYRTSSACFHKYIFPRFRL